MNGFFGMGGSGSGFGGFGGFGGMFKPGMKPMGGTMQLPMAGPSRQSPFGSAMQGPMSTSYFPQAPGPADSYPSTPNGLMGGLSGGDMLGMASQALSGGQQAQGGQEQPPSPPPSFYQKSSKPAPRLSGLQYEQPRQPSRLNFMLGGQYGG